MYMMLGIISPFFGYFLTNAGSSRALSSSSVYLSAALMKSSSSGWRSVRLISLASSRMSSAETFFTWICLPREVRVRRPSSTISASMQ